jgi:hypothetical protein
MSRSVAKQQFDYAWSLYLKGLRSDELKEKTKVFAMQNRLPPVYFPAMHCIAEYVRDNPTVAKEDAMRGLLLAVEFASYPEGLVHHVVRSCAFKAGMTVGKDERVPRYIIDQVKQAMGIGDTHARPGPEEGSLKSNPVSRATKEVRQITHRSPESVTETEGKTPSPSRDKSGRARLVQALRHLTPDMRAKLAEEKSKVQELDKPEFIWHFLLQSFSTMGNSRGYQGLILNQANYRMVTFDVLSKMSRAERLDRLQRIFSAAALRMPVQKARRQADNYDLIVSWGGIEATKKMALAQRGRDAKISFMRRFHGIGEKYARNIWMDVYHPDFYDSIAVDERIKKITDAMGYHFSSYRDHEGFYLDIAKEAGLQGWELDRLLYNFNEEFLYHIRKIG